MKIETNGLIIERLQEKDIELVRQWRNSDAIRTHMNYREIITPEMQRKWFSTINNFNNFYFIIHYKGKKVGLGNIKNIDWEEKSGEAGVFIVRQNISGTFLPVAGVLCLSELVFSIFNLEKLYAQVRKDNPRAQKFNRLFGYKMLSGEEDKESRLHMLTKADFYKSTKKLFLLFKPFGLKTNSLVISIEEVDYLTDFGKRTIQLLNSSPLLFDISKEGSNLIYRQR